MQIEVRRYTESSQAEWDAFIEKNKRNATFLHLRGFFKHNPANEKDDCSLMFYKKNKLKAVLPATVYEREGKRCFHSHPRSTYGGFILDNEAGVEEAVEVVGATVDFAKGNDIELMIVRNPFRIFQDVPSDETDYAMWFHGFSIRSRELECAVKLDELIDKRYENGAKYNIKKAWKTVEVKETQDYERFWQMLTDNLREKHGSEPTHTLEQFKELIKQVGEEKIKLFGGFIEGQLVCGAAIFICNNLALHAQYIASDSKFQDIRPLNAVLDQIIKWGRNNGYKYFNLGTANEDAGRKINYGLFHFKEGFGGRGVLRETMHLDLKQDI